MTKRRQKSIDEFVAPGLERLRTLQTSARDESRIYMRRLMTRALERALEAAGVDQSTAVRALIDPLRNQSAGGPDDPDADELVQRIVREVEAAIRPLGFQPLLGVAAGTTHAASLTPLSATAFGSSAMIGVPIATLTFAHLLSKALAPLIFRVVSTENGMVGLVLGQPSGRHEVDALERFRELMAAVVLRGDAGRAPPYTPAADWRWWNAASLFRHSMQFFCIAHEYGHLLAAHGGFAVSEVASHRDRDVPEASEAIAEEAFCDSLAMRAATHRADETPMAIRMAAPMALMKTIGLLQRDGHLPVGDGHPAASLRSDVMRGEVLRLQSRGMPRKEVFALARSIARMEHLIETAWLDVRDTLAAVDLDDPQRRSEPWRTLHARLKSFAEALGAAGDAESGDDEPTVG